MDNSLQTHHDEYPRHYHGDHVRWLFLTNSVVLLIAFPLFKTAAVIPVIFGTVLVITLMVLAGLTTSKYKWVHIANMVVALMGVAIFEVLAFATDLTTDPLVFLIRQGVALSFLLALYFTPRTVLGIFSKKQQVFHSDISESTTEPEESNEALLQEIKERNEHRP
jgi:FtsH-binding integral membrane protein